MTKKRTIAVASATAILLVSGAAAALADTAVVDGDLAAAGPQSVLSLGTIPCNAPTAASVSLWANRSGQGVGTQTFADSAVLTASLAPPSQPLAAGVSMGTANTITLPSNWQDLANSTASSPTSVPLSVTPTQTGSGSETLGLSLTGRGSTGNTVTRTATLAVTWTTDCTPAPPPVTNTPPTAPGSPVATSPVNQGAFTLNWAASTDAQGDAFTYTLEGENASGVWQTVATNIPTPSYTFTAGNPGEGTWTYRVKAVETSTSPALSSDYSQSSATVTVDRTAPNAPIAATDTAAVYSDGSTNWWKGAVTVSFAGNGDPALADGSAGSGVDQVSGPQTFSEAGAFSASGTAEDAAGNVSAPTVLSGKIDTAAPTVSATCPSNDVVMGSAATASWTAADEDGGSGVKGASSGTIALDTSSIGNQTATIPAGVAVDNVGNASDAVTCTYNVIYNFSGFFQPVNMSAPNVVKAGSAVPIKFSLNGDYGLNILTGAPQFAVKGAAVSGAAITDTVTAGASSLSYDPTTDQYTYVWKTDKAWAGQSGVLTVTLNDGTTHTATFSFTK